MSNTGGVPQAGTHSRLLSPRRGHAQREADPGLPNHRRVTHEEQDPVIHRELAARKGHDSARLISSSVPGPEADRTARDPSDGRFTRLL